MSSGLDKSASSTTLNDGIKEGYLTCKVACLDGRKATDRSWKTVYAVLKAKALYMFKDKKMATENLEYEEKPVKLAESEVEVANDYTKRKNVFRVKTVVGSEYLFQVFNSIPEYCALTFRHIFYSYLIIHRDIFHPYLSSYTLIFSILTSHHTP